MTKQTTRAQIYEMQQSGVSVWRFNIKIPKDKSASYNNTRGSNKISSKQLRLFTWIPTISGQEIKQ